jgi:hypothetical protein
VKEFALLPVEGGSYFSISAEKFPKITFRYWCFERHVPFLRKKEFKHDLHPYTNKLD